MPDEFGLEWITTKEAAALTGYESAHIRHLAREGAIVGGKFGRDWMISRASVVAYARRMEELGPGKHDPWASGGRQKVS